MSKFIAKAGMGFDEESGRCVITIDPRWRIVSTFRQQIAGLQFKHFTKADPAYGRGVAEALGK